MKLLINTLFEPKVSTWQYIVACSKTKEAAIIDPVLDYEPAVFTIASCLADALLSIVLENDYIIPWILKTFVHGVSSPLPITAKAQSGKQAIYTPPSQLVKSFASPKRYPGLYRFAEEPFGFFFWDTYLTERANPD